MLMFVRHVSAICITSLLLAVVLRQPVANAYFSTQGLAANSSIYLPLVTRQISLEEQVVALVNQQRHQHGCMVDVTISPQLAAAAYTHSRDMALNNFFDHRGSDGSDMVQRATEAGYTFRMLAENLQAGSTQPQAVVDSWMNSSSHRANILNCSLLNIGIGYYYEVNDQAIPNVGGPFFTYWTQDFGTP